MEFQNTYVFIVHLPGAGGNFLSRCLNISPNTYCWCRSADKMLPVELADKMEMFDYSSVLDRGSSKQSWVDFEKRLVLYQRVKNHYDIPMGSTSIWCFHDDGDLDILTDPINKNVRIYIDPTDAFEWCVLNALYKNSYHNVNYFRAGKRMLEDPSVIKFPLISMIQGWQEFSTQLKKIQDLIGLECNKQEQDAIRTLYLQWQQTTLPFHRFREFKQDIGWMA